MQPEQNHFTEPSATPFWFGTRRSCRSFPESALFFGAG